MNKKFKFYDTCSLLMVVDNLFQDEEESIPVISTITLNELENIKTSTNKDADIKYSARKLLHKLNENLDKCIIYIFNNEDLKPIEEKNLPVNNDTQILANAIAFKVCYPDDEVIFITNDLSLKMMAKIFFYDKVNSINEDFLDTYSGYYEISMNNEMLIDFYSNQEENMFNLLPNQYLIIKDDDSQIIDKRCWTGNDYRPITYGNFDSKWFGKVKPMKDDIYQALFADSLLNNTITMVRGPAGSGKTFLSLAFLLNQLDRGRIDKIIIFCNTVATKNSAKLGYYPGTRDEKLLDSQIGNLLTSKFGGRIAVEQMIEQEKLVLLPLSDIRGYDTTGMRAGIYISEAQNMDISLMKLALQRIGNDSICIIDGDDKTQVDDISFAGANNGMRRASKVFRGTSVYGEIELKNIHRSTIARIAENM